MEPGTHESRMPDSNRGETLEPERHPAFEMWETSPATRGIAEIFVGPQGLRAGWSLLLFLALCVYIGKFAGVLLVSLNAFQPNAGFTPQNMFFGEFDSLVALLASAAFMAILEQRRLVEYYLTGTQRARHFFSGLAVGFAALSVLVGGLAAGGWLHLGGPTLSAAADLRYALFWGCVFLMVGCVEEGSFRCYLQFTLTRGINFWWALGGVGFLCVDLALKARMHLDLLALLSFHAFRTARGGALGVYVIALLGLAPCLLLHLRRAEGSAFWQAAWVTSTLFGFVHTSNGGENWVGIFSAAAIGFVFCVSIRVTGSAWWAIGCHAGWDWAETYFYGTADSGLVPRGHFLTTTPAGNPLWSGGSDGPEGSLLIVGILVLFLLWLVAVYGRKRPVHPAEFTAG